MKISGVFTLIFLKISDSEACRAVFVVPHGACFGKYQFAANSWVKSWVKSKKIEYSAGNAAKEPARLRFSLVSCLF